MSKIRRVHAFMAQQYLPGGRTLPRFAVHRTTLVVVVINTVNVQKTLTVLLITIQTSVSSRISQTSQSSENLNRNVFSCCLEDEQRD